MNGSRHSGVFSCFAALLCVLAGCAVERDFGPTSEGPPLPDLSTATRAASEAAQALPEPAPEPRIAMTFDRPQTHTPCATAALEPDACILLDGRRGERVQLTGPEGFSLDARLPLSLGQLRPGAYLLHLDAEPRRLGLTVRDGQIRRVHLESADFERDLAHSLLVADYHFLPPPGLRVINPEHPEGLTFQHWEAMQKAARLTRADRRRLRYRRPLRRNFAARQLVSASTADMDARHFHELQEQVRMVVLHHDATRTSHKAHNVLTRRGLSTHIMINWDGTLYQGLDLAYAAWASSRLNPVAVAIDLNNIAVARRARRDPARRLRQYVSGRINGATRESLTYTEAQYEALLALADELLLIFPSIRATAPLDTDGEVIAERVRGIDDFQGFVGHLHYARRSWDPGPGFDWVRLLDHLEHVDCLRGGEIGCEDSLLFAGAGEEDEAEAIEEARLEP